MNNFNNLNNLKLKQTTLNFNNFSNINYFHNLCNNFSIDVEKILKIKLTDTNDYFNDLYLKIPHHSQR